ncbi:MAG: transglutaminase-like domain-containing protein [Defluviitaleaceae bacterium]|nr:transglutaminase-like domain-containing protein [Defluviitaleaceae bacterium]
MRKISWSNEIFFIVMGSLLVWSLFLAIISATELNFDPTSALIMAFFSLLVMRVIMYNKITLIVAGGILVVAGIIIALDAAIVNSTNTPFAVRISIFDNIADIVTGAIRYIAGFESYQPHYDTLISWTIIISLGLFVIVTGFFLFNFFAMLALSVAVFAISLNSGFFEYYAAFYVFVFCIVAFLIKHLNQRSLGVSKASPFALYAMPFTAICLVIALVIPAPAIGSADNFRQNFINRPFTAINNAIQGLLHPRYFSLSQTGFGGGGTRQLGGNVALNNALAMRISPSSRGSVHYLTGAIFDTYSGTTWENTFRNDVFALDFTQTEQNLELLERQTSALTMWTVADFFDVYNGVQREFEEIVSTTMYYVYQRHVELTLEFSGDENMQHILLSSEEQLLRTYHNLRSTQDMAVRIAMQQRFDQAWGEVFRLPITADGHVVYDTAALDFILGRHGGFSTFVRSMPNTFSEAVTTTLRPESIIFEHDFRSHSVFFSGIVMDAAPANNTEFYRDQSDSATADTLMQRGERYVIHFAETAENINTHNILAASYRGVLRDAYNALISNNGFDPSNLNFSTHHIDDIGFTHLLYEYLIPRANWIFEHYTQLPPELPQSVGNLARYVTRYAENDFERAVMVTEFLRNNFEYTLTPGATPAGRDFVEWFLFDAGQGYCVHFATAFVVMMRSLGVPTRYVEGFMASGNVGSDGFLDVINRQGHAWGEIYFEGFGWYLFEPTPPRGIFRWESPDSPTSTEPTSPEWGGGRDWDNFNWASVEEMEGGWDNWDDLNDPTFASANDPTDAAATPYYQNQNVNEADNEQTFGFGRLLSMSIYIVFGIFAFYVALRILLGIWRSKKLRKKDNNTAVQSYFNKMLQYLSFFNYSPLDGDTPLEFAQKISRRMSFENEKIFMEDIVYIYYKSQYSQSLITGIERDTMESAVVALEERLKSYVGKWRFFFYKYIRAIM